MTLTKYQKIIVTGSLSFDHIMAMPGRFRDHIIADKLHILNVSFIMDQFRKEFGGTGGNIAYSLGLLNTPNYLVGAAGHDFQSYKDHLNKIQAINTTGVKAFKTEPTATGFAMTDRDDNQVWGFYQGAMKFAKRLSISNLVNAKSLVIIAPDDATAMRHYARQAQVKKADYLFDPAFNIVHFPRAEFRQIISKAHIIIGNDYEINLITKRSGMSVSKILSKVSVLITTLGAKGSIIRSGGKVIKVTPARVKRVVDPTGAGDAYRAGFIAGYTRGFDLEMCGKIGSVAAAYAVETYGTQAHRFSMGQFKLRFYNNFSERLNL